MDLVNAVYQTTKRFPKEMHPLTLSLRKIALSVPSQIAKGSTDGTGNKLSPALSRVIFSLEEMETQLESALNMGYIIKHDHGHLRNIVSECMTLTNVLRTGREHS